MARFGNAKAQSALEYLITYGWAILIITVVLVAIAALGLFSPNRISSTQCLMPGGFSCLNYQLYSNGTLFINLEQSTQYHINITAIGCNTQPSTVSFTDVTPQISLPVNGNTTFDVQCYVGPTAFSGSSGTLYNGYVGVNYTESVYNIKHTIYGTVTARVSR